MKVDTMRTIDRAFGPPLCFVLSMARRLLLRRRVERLPARPRLLFVKLSEKGSIVLMRPALRLARELWPDCEISLLVFKENRDAAELVRAAPPENILCVR